MKMLIGLLALLVLVIPTLAAEAEGPSKEEVAKELANPNTALSSLKFQFQYYKFDGDLERADKQDFYQLFFQPVLPFPLDNGYTVWVRPGVPIIFDRPTFDVSELRLDDESGLGDCTLDVQYGTTLENGFLWSVGFSALFPTATPDELGSGQWTLGPGFQLGVIKEKSILGVFANHQWDIAGDGKSTPDHPFFRELNSGDASTSVSAIQLFGVYLPGDGWSVGSTPIITYNHESSQWTVPLHVVIGKTVIMNGRPVELSVDINYYVEQADEIGLQWMIGFNISPVVENIFARWFK